MFRATATVLLALAVLARAEAFAQNDAPPTDGPPAAEAPAAGSPSAEAPAPEVAGPPAPMEPPPPIYEDKLLRLAEILGSLHFLRGLCGDGDAGAWRKEMEALLAAESPGPLRRARLIGRFNHGLETFNATYRSCTPSARRAIWLYLQHGRAISSDIQARYSQ
jgi:uncharacterized protein (TIGR02301 family)